MLLKGNLFQPVTLSLVLAIPGKDLLLLSDQVSRGHDVLRRVRIIRLLLCELRLLVCDSPDYRAVTVDLLLLVFQFLQLIPDADDVQQDLGLVRIVRFHEARQVERQLLYKGVQELLSTLPARRIRDLQV